MTIIYKITYHGGEQYGLDEEVSEFSSRLECERYAERQARVVDQDTKNEHSLRFDVAEINATSYQLGKTIPDDLDPFHVRFPIVEGDEWCGEFQREPPSQE